MLHGAAQRTFVCVNIFTDRYLFILFVFKWPFTRSANKFRVFVRNSFFVFCMFSTLRSGEEKCARNDEEANKNTRQNRQKKAKQME